MNSQTDTLTYIRVTTDNLPIALDIFQKVWRDRPIPEYYINKTNYPNDPSDTAWIVNYKNQPIGITGTYTFDLDESGYDHDESIWMEYFALLHEFRGQGLGEQVLLDTINYCKNLQTFKYYRLDTTYLPNRPAISLYDKVMQLREDYTTEHPSDPEAHYLVYSYSLTNAPVKPWGNQLLNLGQDAEGLHLI